MALLFIGKTRCPLCGEIIEEGQKVVAFPPFIENQLDPLWVFNDSALHAECFNNHPLAGKAQSRYKEVQEHQGPGNRFCVVCKMEIRNPDDYFTVGHLIEDKGHSLYPYNYKQAHISCLTKWPDLPHLYDEIEKLQRSKTWGGDALINLLAQLRPACIGWQQERE